MLPRALPILDGGRRSHEVRTSVVSVDQDWLALEPVGCAPRSAAGERPSGATKTTATSGRGRFALLRQGTSAVMQVLADQGISIGKFKFIRRDP